MPSYKWTVPLAESRPGKLGTPGTLPACASTSLWYSGYAGPDALTVWLSASKWEMKVWVPIALDVTPEKKTGSIIAEVPIVGIIWLPLSW